MIFGAPVAATRDGQGPVLMAGTDGSDRVWAGSLGDAPVPWAALDGSLRCVCAETNADGRVELFGVNGSGSPFHRAQASAGAAAWTPWAPLTGRFTSVAAARNADGRVELFGVTSAGSAVLWRVQASPGVWTGSAWQPLGALATAVAAGRDGDGTLHLFICDEDRRVQEASQAPGGTWSAWAQLDSDWARYGIRQLAVGSAAGALTLIGVDTDGQACTRSQKILGIWGPWTAISRTLRPSLLPSTTPHIATPGDQSTVLDAPVDLQLTVSGGTSPLTWSYAGLPTGLAGDATGRVTGTPEPTGVSAHPVTATVTDANYLTDAVTLHLEHAGPGPRRHRRQPDPRRVRAAPHAPVRRPDLDRQHLPRAGRGGTAPEPERREPGPGGLRGRSDGFHRAEPARPSVRGAEVARPGSLAWLRILPRLPRHAGKQARICNSRSHRPRDPASAA